MKWPLFQRRPTRPTVEPSREDRIAVARVLNRGGVSAAPLDRLAVISIFDDEEYENYEFDVIRPRRRARLVAMLAEAGFRQTRGLRFESRDGAVIALPKPGILGTDPSWPVRDLLAAGHATVLTTPTQAVLLYAHAFADEPPEAIADELLALVWEQPANLDKTLEWARAAGHDHTLRVLRPQLEAAQAEGTRLREQRRFQSRLPR